MSLLVVSWRSFSTSRSCLHPLTCGPSCVLKANSDVEWCWCVESFLNSKYLWLLLLFSRAHVVTLGPPGQSSLSHYFKGSWLIALSTSTNSFLSCKAKQLRLWHQSVKVIGAKILPTSVTLEVGFPRSEDRHGPKVCSDLTSRLPRWLSG